MPTICLRLFRYRTTSRIYPQHFRNPMTSSICLWSPIPMTTRIYPPLFRIPTISMKTSEAVMEVEVEVEMEMEVEVEMEMEMGIMGIMGMGVEMVAEAEMEGYLLACRHPKKCLKYRSYQTHLPQQQCCQQEMAHLLRAKDQINLPTCLGVLAYHPVLKIFFLHL